MEQNTATHAHPDFLSLASARPSSVIRNSSFLSLQSIAISVVTPSEAGSEFRWPEPDEKHPASNENEHTATPTSPSGDPASKIHKTLFDLEHFLHGVADRLKRVSFFPGDASAEDGGLVVKQLHGGKGGEDFGKLIVDELDAANLVHANIRLMKCLRAKVDALSRLERELQGLVEEKRRDEGVSSAFERRASSSSGSDTRLDDDTPVHRASSGSSTDDWDDDKETELAILEAKLKDAQSRWSDSQEDLIEPIEELRAARKRHLRRTRQEQKLTRKLTRELTKEKTFEKTKLKQTTTSLSLDDGKKEKAGVGRFFKKLLN